MEEMAFQPLQGRASDREGTMASLPCTPGSVAPRPGQVPLSLFQGNVHTRLFMKG